MFRISDTVVLKTPEATICQITGERKGDKGMLYLCTPLGFNTISKEYSEDKLEKVV